MCYFRSPKRHFGQCFWEWGRGKSQTQKKGMHCSCVLQRCITPNTRHGRGWGLPALCMSSLPFLGQEDPHSLTSWYCLISTSKCCMRKYVWVWKGKFWFILLTGSIPAHLWAQRGLVLAADQPVLDQTLEKEKTQSVAMGIVDVPGGQQEMYVSPGRTASPMKELVGTGQSRPNSSYESLSYSKLW